MSANPAKKSVDSKETSKDSSLDLESFECGMDSFSELTSEYISNLHKFRRECEETAQELRVLDGQLEKHITSK